MGNLPKSRVGTKTLTIGGEPVEVRGLLRSEVGVMLAPLHEEGADEAAARERCDVLAVAMGLGVTEDEAAGWMAEAPAGHVIKVIEAVMELSGMTEDTGKG